MMVSTGPNPLLQGTASQWRSALPGAAPEPTLGIT
jgi:hypothetical protein